MSSIHSPNEYHKYESTTGGSKGNGGGGGSKGPGCGCRIVIIIVAIMLISFVDNGASWDAIDTLLGLGLIAYWIANSWCR